MRQVTFDTPGQPEVLYLTDVEIPKPGPGQVLIRVAAAGVNGPDLAQRKGNYPPPADASPVLGLEVAGEIVALGQGVAQWQTGQEVCALVPGGGYSEYVPPGPIIVCLFPGAGVWKKPLRFPRLSLLCGAICLCEPGCSKARQCSSTAALGGSAAAP